MFILLFIACGSSTDDILHNTCDAVSVSSSDPTAWGFGAGQTRPPPARQTRPTP